MDPAAQRMADINRAHDQLRDASIACGESPGAGVDRAFARWRAAGSGQWPKNPGLLEAMQAELAEVA